ncbi:hypothetical protein HZH68_007167 [Vespula germanica]|uniref:Uncharacterized protein n=1 Tax=Vespula germanica TaxID=30212 RepID=A0A834K753_VESGE|nr:hypothetical protein HZH68_007167 [Vespula germanica]
MVFCGRLNVSPQPGIIGQVKYVLALLSRPYLKQVTQSDKSSLKVKAIEFEDSSRKISKEPMVEHGKCRRPGDIACTSTIRKSVTGLSPGGIKSRRKVAKAALCRTSTPIEKRDREEREEEEEEGGKEEDEEEDGEEGGKERWKGKGRGGGGGGRRRSRPKDSDEIGGFNDDEMQEG